MNIHMATCSQVCRVGEQLCRAWGLTLPLWPGTMTCKQGQQGSRRGIAIILASSALRLLPHVALG